MGDRLIAADRAAELFSVLGVLQSERSTRALRRADYWPAAEVTRSTCRPDITQSQPLFSPPTRRSGGTRTLLKVSS